MSPVHVIMCKGLNHWSLLQVTTPYALTHMLIHYHVFQLDMLQNIMTVIIVYSPKVVHTLACMTGVVRRLCLKYPAIILQFFNCLRQTSIFNGTIFLSGRIPYSGRISHSRPVIRTMLWLNGFRPNIYLI